MRARLLLLLLVVAGCPAEIIDRVAVTAGRRAITESDLLKEIRLNAFMNLSRPDFGSESRRKTAERLVERILVENEIDLGAYPAPDSARVEEQLADFKKEQLPSAEAYAKALFSYELNDSEVRRYLLKQLAVLDFIDARFGPGVQVLEQDVRAYYEGAFRKRWENSSRKPLPDFEEVYSQIEEILHAESVNRLLDQWLKEVRDRTRIEFKPEAFQ
jgi:hypothetical protein